MCVVCLCVYSNVGGGVATAADYPAEIVGRAQPSGEVDVSSVASRRCAVPEWFWMVFVCHYHQHYYHHHDVGAATTSSYY